MNQIKHYLRDIRRIENTGIYTEVSFYSPLERMIHRVAKVCNQNVLFVAGGTVSKDMRPDITILSPDHQCIGHIEAKTLYASIDYIEKHDQLKKYRKVLPNLILTSFNEFFFYRDGKVYERILLDTTIEDMEGDIVTEDNVLVKAMKKFLKYRMKHVKLFNYKQAFDEDYEKYEYYMNGSDMNGYVGGTLKYTDEDLFSWNEWKNVVIDGKNVRVTVSDYQQGYVIRKSRRMIRQIL